MKIFQVKETVNIERVTTVLEVKHFTKIKSAQEFAAEKRDHSWYEDAAVRQHADGWVADKVAGRTVKGATGDLLNINILITKNITLSSIEVDEG